MTYHTLSTNGPDRAGSTFRTLSSAAASTPERVTLFTAHQDTPALEKQLHGAPDAPRHAENTKFPVSSDVPLDLPIRSNSKQAFDVNTKRESSGPAATNDPTRRGVEKSSSAPVTSGSGEGNKPPGGSPPATSGEDPNPDRDPKSSRTLFDAVYSSVVTGITSGELQPGRPIDWGAIRAATKAKPRTIARARKVLIDEGYVSAVRGVGTFVGNEAPDVKPTPPRRVPIQQQTVTAHISARIASGELKPGMPIDWEEVATQTGVPVTSMARSRHALVQEGLICSIRGLGTFVGKERPPEVKRKPPRRKPVKQQKIIDHVSARIASGELKPGMPIDWEEISAQTGIPVTSTGRVRHALIQEGLICGVRGVGTFVGKEPPPDAKRKPPRRKPVKQQKVIDHVSAQIASGELQHGAIIDWDEVAEQTGTQAMGRPRRELKRLGLVSTVRGVGTFVGKEPPPGVKAIPPEEPVRNYHKYFGSHE